MAIMLLVAALSASILPPAELWLQIALLETLADRAEHN